ncbi:FK506-binding protein 2-like [Lineus longissimus]|uniref:FK506-binding protein 2-like n=1 Tax=Lineus longissimus TaxID=88925 RepID=UPI002B4EA451
MKHSNLNKTWSLGNFTNMPQISLTSMQLFIIFLICILFGTSLSKKNQKNLEIIVQHEPAVCTGKAANGDKVFVHYTGVLEATGAVFDSSKQQGREPISFTLGKNMVIQGWEQGIVGMCVGEKRKLIIGPELAYGKQGRPPMIPGDSTLVFDTELINVEKKPMGEGFFNFMKVMFIPLTAGFIVYHLYRKYSLAPSKKELKEEKKKGKKKH